MSVETNCPKCQKQYAVPPEMFGKRLRCKQCGHSFAAPDSNPDSGPASPSAATVLTLLGRFQVKGKLGAGAFGTVYRAYDPQLDREVALKVPNPGTLTDAKRTERFLREAKAAANLRHPHIVPVFDAGKDGDNYYIASAFISGQTLSHSIPEGGMAFADAARAVRELAEALAYAHEQGIVHRDVKPANIMRDAHGHIHLMDFGLAMRQDEEARLTNDGVVMGTAAYMSPEQARGATADVGPASDQYAAGVVLYELLTGTVPFKGPTPVVIHNVIHAEPDPPRRRRKSVPKDLETICLKAMAKAPGERYPTCQALADDLRRWMEGEPISARRRGISERIERWIAREQKLILAGYAVLAVAVVSTIAVTVITRRSDETLKRQEENAAEVQAATKRELVIAQNNLAKATKELTTAYALLNLSLPQVLKGHAGPVESAAFSPDGTRIVTAGGGTARVWDVRTGAEVLALKGHAARVCAAAFSPDGTRIVTAGGGGTARVWDAKTGAEVLALGGHTDSVEAAFSPDGTRIVTAGGGGTARVWDAKTGAEVLALKGHAARVCAAAFGPDGTRVVTGHWDGTARVWDARTGAEVLALKVHTLFIHAAAFSPDGSRMLTVGSNSGGTPSVARVWDVRTGAEVLALKGHTNWVAAACWSPDGTRIVTAGGDDTARVWDARTGAEVLTLKGHADWVTGACFSPEGVRIVTASKDGTARVWLAPPP